MNTKNENFTPKERVDAQLLAQLLRENDDMETKPGAESVPAAACPQMRCGNARRCAPTRRETCQRIPVTNCPARGRSLAMVYSPKQEFTDLYEAEEGLRRGTIFMQLDLPLETGCCREGRWEA